MIQCPGNLALDGVSVPADIVPPNDEISDGVGVGAGAIFTAPRTFTQRLNRLHHHQPVPGLLTVAHRVVIRAKTNEEENTIETKQ